MLGDVVLVVMLPSYEACCGVVEHQQVCEPDASSIALPGSVSSAILVLAAGTRSNKCYLDAVTATSRGSMLASSVHQSLLKVISTQLVQSGKISTICYEPWHWVQCFMTGQTQCASIQEWQCSI
eukprot:GHRR01007460.1.p2 GENE.GHRR01007460.1~~GHRR01007460.1.p2  ORF type:complete len:124 (+),score=27.24 GHRR01007460.1:1426-1797(+)